MVLARILATLMHAVQTTARNHAAQRRIDINCRPYRCLCGALDAQKEKHVVLSLTIPTPCSHELSCFSSDTRQESPPETSGVNWCLGNATCLRTNTRMAPTHSTLQGWNTKRAKCFVFRPQTLHRRRLRTRPVTTV